MILLSPHLPIPHLLLENVKVGEGWQFKKKCHALSQQYQYSYFYPPNEFLPSALNQTKIHEGAY